MKSNSFVLHITHADCLLIKCHFFSTVTLENCCSVVIEIILSLFSGRWTPLSVCVQNSHAEFRALTTDPWRRVSSAESQGSLDHVTSDSHPLVLGGRSLALLPHASFMGLTRCPSREALCCLSTHWEKEKSPCYLCSLPISVRCHSSQE